MRAAGETVLGVVVLGVVLGGAYWVGVRRPPSQWAARGQAIDRESPDVTLHDGTVDLGDVLVTLSVSPRPPVAFATLTFHVRVSSARAHAPGDDARAVPVNLERGRISFEMTMPMGDHRYALVGEDGGWHQAAVVLPSCPSGNVRWYATVEGIVDGRPRSARFRLDLARPPGRTTP